jgi:hypothetical protein
MDPTALRAAADAYDRKASLLFAAGCLEEANAAWDRAIDLRLRANQQEDQQTRGPAT